MSLSVSALERQSGMHAEISRRQFLARGGRADIGVGLAGSLLAGCGGGGSGSGQVTYWSNLEGSGPQYYFKTDIEKPFEKANKGTDLKVTFQPPDRDGPPGYDGFAR